MNETTPPPAEVRTNRWTVPNLLCLIRLVGSLVLVAIALADAPEVFLVTFLVLALSDYLDGKLAIWLDQQTTFGARLDTVADAVLFGAILFGAVWMKGDRLWAESAWLFAAIGSYAVSVAASYAKFRKLPSYHTRAAKTSNFLMLLAAAALFSGWAIWPLRLACAAVTLTNLEALAITRVLRHWRVNIPSLYHALRDVTRSRRSV
jgi:cardiolipin synthase (CMP-forming)